MDKSQDICRRCQTYYSQTLVQHRRSYKELVSRKLINPCSKDVCSAGLALEDYGQFNVLTNDDNEQEQVLFNDLSDSETTELIETIKRLSNLLQNKTWSSLPMNFVKKYKCQMS